MHAVVAGAAPERHAEWFYRPLVASAEIVVAADAAAEWCVALGRVPDAAVGDFDSAAPGAADRLRAQRVRVLTCDAAKDVSDLDLAVAEARNLGATGLTITAAYSARLDHTLASLGTLIAAADLQPELAEPSAAAWVVGGGAPRRLALTGPAGALVSVFAVEGTAEGVSLAGMRYALADAVLRPLSSHGLSNELAEGGAEVSVAAGCLLVLSPGLPAKRASRR